VEADEALVHGILEANLASDESTGIACYNGSRSFTLAGSTKAIDALARTLAEKSRAGEGVKSKRLNVINAFHSALVESLVDRLGEVGKGPTFHDAVIPIERATEHGDPAARLDWSFVGSHMRQPVFFNYAIQRLVKKHPQAIFLEAGSNSTTTVMAARALAQAAPTTSDALHFQSVSITNTKKGIDGLTDTTVALWKQGLRVFLRTPPGTDGRLCAAPPAAVSVREVAPLARAQVAYRGDYQGRPKHDRHWKQWTAAGGRSGATGTAITR
ncbi:MAG: hypothetical protein M1816_005579, partial [Peltula sp. TS41687]